MDIIIKASKFFFFLLAIMGVDLAQNLAKYKRWFYVHVLIQLTNISITQLAD